MAKSSTKVLIGWREWVALPGLGISSIKAKIDTGARTSALHALDIETYHAGTQLRVRFAVKPHHEAKERILCDTDVVDQRHVKDSGGRSEERLVIRSTIKITEKIWPMEITLTDRSQMRFEMLIGRTAMRGKVQVDPGKSFLTGKA